VNTELPDAFGAALNGPSVDGVAIMGVARASKLARCGKIISAIKYIEEANPEISRERAKWIVYSFGYNGESRWPELERWPERNRLPVRCL
jgi:hypothetical protein